MPHYYSPDTAGQQRPAWVTFGLAGQTVRAQVDRGVFSPKGLDMGTRVLVEALPALPGPVLELGGGWGALALAANCRFPGLDWTLVEPNPRAADLARANLQTAHMQATVLCEDGIQFPMAHPTLAGAFATVLTNPPVRAGNAVLAGLFDAAHTALRPGGHLILVMRRQQGAESWRKKLQAQFSRVDIVARDAGYWVMDCVKA